jgi:hypothetical protein
MTEHTDTERTSKENRVPDRDLLVEIFDRVNLLSDEINDPDGLLSRQLEGSEQKATRRHVQVMAVMKKVLGEILVVKAEVAAVQRRVGVSEARIKILDHSDVEAPGVQ